MSKTDLDAKKDNTTGSTKDENYWKILNAAIELDYKKGHEKWTITELSRKSKVTRSLIYYYFGRSKGSIIAAAVKLVGEELIGLNKQRQNLWKNGELVSSMKEARVVYEKCKALGPFILEHYDRPTEIGETIRKIEADFVKRLQQTFPKLDLSQTHALYAVYWGLSFSPKVDEKVIFHAITAVQQYLKIK